MADVEDDTEFGSHFLDSMLEVEMTEEDGELDVSKNEDTIDENRRALPPIPTFDLQSETLSYKDLFRNPLVPPVLSNLPLGTPIKSETVALNSPVLKPGPMLTIYSRDLLPNKISTNIIKPIPSVQKTSPKSNVKPSPAKTFVKAPPLSEQVLAAQFLKQLFKPEYVKNVFVKKDPPRDISQVGKEEMEYYKACFKDVYKVQYCRLHCTICDKHLGCGTSVEKKLTVHNMLKVLTCKSCYEFYGDGNFPCDEGDNCEIYCRWCGQGGALVCCSFCPKVFCKKCVRQNFGPSFLKSIQKASDWACFCCAQKPLWPHRAICRALVKYVAQKKTDPKASQKDTTKCCNLSVLNKNKVKPMDKNEVIVSQGQFKINLSPGISIAPSDLKRKLILPVKTVSGKEQSILKSDVHSRVSDQKNKTAIYSNKFFNKNLKANATSNTLSKSLTSGNNVLRSLSTSSPSKSYSTLLSPQLIQSPVLHGETLITPPGSRKSNLSNKAPSNASSGNPFVRVSLTNQTSNLDISKIPTAKIPHDIQGLILRMSFPDNKVQLVRLVTDGNGCKASKDFPMPEFKNLEDLTFVEENLSDSFALSKMIYEKLLAIKEKVNSKNRFKEESLHASSVKKLHLVYEKSIKLIKELDETLMGNFEKWKSQGKTPVDVINLSDEDSKGTPEKSNENQERHLPTFVEKCKELLHSDDSDIEILEDAPRTSFQTSIETDDVEAGNAANGDPQNSVPDDGSVKEKYRLRSSSVDRSKSHRNDENSAPKRKKTGKKNCKRLKSDTKDAKVKNGNEAEVKMEMANVSERSVVPVGESGGSENPSAENGLRDGKIDKEKGMSETSECSF